MLAQAVASRFADLVSGAGALALPILPEAVSAVIAESGRADGDARRLAELARRDPGLSANLLRIANSAVYGARVPITSIQQAISRLGRAAIRQIALVVATKTAVFRVDGHESEVRRLFRHAFASALFAQEIARLRRWNVEEAFLCGLFHDIGRPVLLQVLVDLCRQEGYTLDMADASPALDAHHEHLGAAIVASWSQPPRVTAAIRHHHDPDAAGDQARSAHVVALADAFAMLVVDPAAAPPREHAALAPLGLYPEDVDALAVRRDDIAAAVAA